MKSGILLMKLTLFFDFVHCPIVVNPINSGELHDIEIFDNSDQYAGKMLCL